MRSTNKMKKTNRWNKLPSLPQFVDNYYFYFYYSVCFFVWYYYYYYIIIEWLQMSLIENFICVSTLLVWLEDSAD